MSQNNSCSYHGDLVPDPQCLIVEGRPSRVKMADECSIAAESKAAPDSSAQESSTRFDIVLESREDRILFSIARRGGVALTLVGLSH